MTHKDDDKGLDDLFAVARDATPTPDLMARVLADADAVLDDVPPVAAPPAKAPKRERWWAGLLDGMGGWSAISGITAAGVVGLGVGLYAPDTVSNMLVGDTLSWGYGTDDFAPDIGDLWTEDGDV